MGFDAHFAFSVITFLPVIALLAEFDNVIFQCIDAGQQIVTKRSGIVHVSLGRLLHACQNVPYDFEDDSAAQARYGS